MSPVEIVAALVTAWGVWLQGRRSLVNFPVNLAGVLMYAWIFFHAKLYSDLLLQGFFAATLLYGWWQWTRGVVPDGTVSVATPAPRELLLGVAGGILGIMILGYPMATYTDAAAPWLDATLTSFSLVANLWLARRYLVNWYLWIGLDVIYVGLYAFKALYVTAGLYFVLLVLCCNALIEWRHALRRQDAPGQGLPQAAS
jgi:nicotinamide mononucleotide transporter